MTISEFKKLRKGAYPFSNAWHRKQLVKTRFGTFQVCFVMMHDDNPPDDEMLRLADELARYVQAHSEEISEIIYGSYRYTASESDPDWLESWEVPADLKPDQIRKYCDPILLVERNPTVRYVGPPYDCSISVQPQWEPEHGLSLELRNGAIVSVNKRPFRIVNGILIEK